MDTTAHQRLTIYGGTGWVGSALASEARARGHVVTIGGRLGAPDRWRRALDTTAADALLVAVPGVVLADVIHDLMGAALAPNARLAVVGGSGSLLGVAGGARLMDADDFRDEWKPEAAAHAEALQALRGAPAALDWFYLSPPASFGAWTGTPSTGTYRTGDDVVVTGADGASTISVADFATAFLDEIASGAHSRRRFTVAQ